MDTSADHHSEQPPQLPPSTSPPPQRTVSPAHTTTTTSGRAASPVHTPSFGHTNSSTYTIPQTSAHAAGTPPMPAIIPIHDVQRQLIKSVLDESLAEFKGAIRQGMRPLPSLSFSLPPHLTFLPPSLFPLPSSLFPLPSFPSLSNQYLRCAELAFGVDTPISVTATWNARHARVVSCFCFYFDLYLYFYFLHVTQM